VIIETKNAKKKSYSISDDINRRYSSVKKSVEPFVPLIIPTRDRSDLKRSMQSLQTA
jgi:predicted transcriptional regulator